jgi:hypothetical protein
VKAAGSAAPGRFGRSARPACKRFGRALPTLALLGAFPVAAVSTGAAVLSAPPALAAGPTCSGPGTGSYTFTDVAGTPQSAKVGTAFATPLEVQVTENIGTSSCPAANVNIQFTVQATGAGAIFNGGLTAVSVETDSAGTATAPALYANNVTGSYMVTAGFDGYSSPPFQLSNTTVGVVSSVTASSGGGQSAQIGNSFATPLQVLVTDTYADPVAGATVNFDVVTTAGAGATFTGGGGTAAVQTTAEGLAVSPTLTAGTTSGVFTVTASVPGASSMATFALTDRAGAATTLTAGVGTSQSAELGTDFPVPLAVTVTDAQGNALQGATVTFAAPATGAGGVFAGAGARAAVLTGSSGVAIAPDFSANSHTGGYVVTASVAGITTPATFALVNEPRSGASAPGPDGSYWLVTNTGKVLASGGAAHFGSMTAKATAPVVGMAATPGGQGYWLVTSKGTVRAFGDAVNYGSPSPLHLSKPIVGMAATPNGKGYWLVASDGGIFNYGAAALYGSPSALHLNKPIVAIAATADGKGYWLVASDGGIFNYGDAAFHGSGHARSAKPIVGIAAAPGGGYWLVASDGTVSAFGGATYYGSGAGLSPKPVKAIVATSNGAGYWVVSANGTAAGFGNAGAQGSPTSAKTTVVAGAP